MLRPPTTLGRFNTFNSNAQHRERIVISITNDRLPWLIDVNVFMTPISQTNFNINTVTTTAIRNGYLRSNGAIDAEISFDLILAKGTWTCELMYTKDANAGIYSVRIDSVEQGTIDGYAAGTTSDHRATITGMNITQAGKHRLTLKMSTKNPSSGSYIGFIQHIQLRRTA